MASVLLLIVKLATFWMSWIVSDELLRMTLLPLVAMKYFSNPSDERPEVISS